MQLKDKIISSRVNRNTVVHFLISYGFVFTIIHKEKGTERCLPSGYACGVILSWSSGGVLQNIALVSSEGGIHRGGETHVIYHCDLHGVRTPGIGNLFCGTERSREVHRCPGSDLRGSIQDPRVRKTGAARRSRHPHRKLDTRGDTFRETVSVLPRPPRHRQGEKSRL